MVRSRYHEILNYWHVKKGQDLTILVKDTKPNGRVRVKEVVAKDDTPSEVANVLMTTALTITVETVTKNDITNNDFVSFRGKDWRVTRVQKRILKGTQYRQRPDELTIIDLRGNA